MLIRLARLSCILLLSVLAACGRLEAPEVKGELVVAIRNGPSSYEASGEDAKGFEYDLVEAFAAQLKVKARYVLAGDQAQLHELVRKGKVHFAAACFAGENPDYLTTSPLREAHPVLVGAGDDETDDIDATALSGKRVTVLNASPQLAALQTLAGSPPRFQIIPRSGVAEFDLMRDVVDGKADYAATDSLQYALALHFEPDLETVMTLPGTIRIGWCFHQEDKALWEQAQSFIQESTASGLLARIRDRYFGYVARVRPEGIAEFFNRMRAELPHLRNDFQAAQAKTGIDWRLLAALAYQESQWDAQATSPTGVRGIMMLTEDTADRLRVSNRLDPKQSIQAGARYLADLRDQLPEEITEPDRTWLALAGYNLGMGHLNGARAIAPGLKRDPNSWYEMKSVLPLMARPEYYSRLKSGRARGGEAVIMVENIRTFYGILSHFEPAWQPGLERNSSAFGLKLK